MIRIRLPLLLVVTFAATALMAAPAMARQPIAVGLSIPDGRDMSVVDRTTWRYGAKPATWTIWSQWGHRGGERGCYPSKRGSCAFPWTAASRLADRGITPIIWWEPVQPNRPTYAFYPRYKNVVDGRHDHYIRRWAKDAAAFGRTHGTKVIVRYAQEVNGQMFPWGVEKFDNDPKTFKKAWRRIYRIFRNQGALPYVDFMWSVSKRSCHGCNPYARVYPGDAFVDYVGISAYNWGAARQWRSMERVLEKPMRDLRKVTRKPVVIIELGSNRRGGDRATWILKGYRAVYHRWNRVKAIVYLDTNQPAVQVGHPDWSLAGSGDQAAVDAYRKIVTDPRFRGRLR